MRQGASFMDTSPWAGVHRRCPLDPRLRGTPSCFLGNRIRRAKSEWLSLLAAGPLGPAQSKILKILR